MPMARGAGGRDVLASSSDNVVVYPSNLQKRRHRLPQVDKIHAEDGGHISKRGGHVR